MKAALPALAGSLMLAACVPAARVPPAPVAATAPAKAAATPTPAASAAPAFQVNTLVAENWFDAPATSGTWRYAALSGSSLATFVAPDDSPLVSLRCDPASRHVVLSLPESATHSYAAEIRTETLTVTLPLASQEGRPSVAIPANLILLDAMALSRGRFAIGAEGMSPLYLPSHAEVSRVIEDCR